MMGEKWFAVVGEDARQAAAGRALARAGCRVGGVEQIGRADYILLPLPLDARQAGLAGLLRAAKPGALALAGKPSAEAKRLAAAAGIEMVDYFAREELAIFNAIPTAEGCIGILLARRSRTLWGAPVLVTGYGPVGQAVAARRAAQRALARSQGGEAIPLEGLAAAAPGFDTVVNTIPAQVVTRPVLAAMGWQVLPIMSFAAAGTDTRFGSAAGWKAKLEAAAGRCWTPWPGSSRWGQRGWPTPWSLRPAPAPPWPGWRRGCRIRRWPWPPRACCGWAARWWRQCPPTTGWGRRERTSPG